MREKLIKIVQLNPREWKRLPQLLESKRELFEGKFILLPEPDPEREELLKNAGIDYIVTNGGCFHRSSTPRPEREKSQKNQSGKSPSPSVEEKGGEEFHKPRRVEIIDRVVRSGQEIITDNDLIFTQRVNGGARIVTSGNVIALEQFEGELVCNGQFLVMLKNKGSIIFDGEEIEPSDKIVVAVDNGRKVEL
jgi:septum site-determining protein MinC